MLQVRQARVHRVAGADPAQAAQREVVVKDQRLLGVVEALDVLAGLGVVGAAVHVLHHVQVLGDVLEVLVLVGVEHLVHEVDVPEVPARPRLVLHLERALDGLLHHVLPVGVLQRHDHLVNVEQGDVLVSATKGGILSIVFRVTCFVSYGAVVSLWALRAGEKCETKISSHMFLFIRITVT